MLKSVLAVVAGYIVMVLFVMVTSVVAFMAMGVDGAFQPGTYVPSGPWIAVVLVLALLAGIIGGYLCAAMARRPGPTKALAVVVMLLGLLYAVPMLMAGPDPRPIERLSNVSPVEAMSYGRQPRWVALLTPVVGVAGVLLGGRLRLRR